MWTKRGNLRVEVPTCVVCGDPIVGTYHFQQGECWKTGAGHRLTNWGIHALWWMEIRERLEPELTGVK